MSDEKPFNRIGEALKKRGEETCHHDLDFLIGSWREDAAFDAAVAAQQQVDPQLWTLLTQINESESQIPQNPT
jgi:hypothetical protein